MLKSLRFRLSVVFIGLAIGPLLCAAHFLTRYSVNYLEQQSQAMLHEVAVRVGNEIRFFVEAQINNFNLIHKLYELESLTPEKQKTIFSNLLFNQQIFQDTALLNPDGQELMRLSRSSVFTGKDLQNRATQKEFLWPSTHKEPYFSTIHFDRNIQEPLVTISVPFADLRTGELAYVLTGDLRFKKIWDLLATIEIPGEGVVYIVDQTNQIVAHRNPSVVLSNTTANLPEVAGRVKGISGTDVIISWDVLELGEQKLMIVVEQPVSKALALVTNHLQIALIVTSMVFVIAIVFVVLATRHFVRPIESMAAGARAISRGDYSTHIVVTSQDELGDLAFAFNTMTQDLEEYNNKMEELVKIRTDELAQANRLLEKDIVERMALEKERELLIEKLQRNLEKVKILSGFLPICASCKKIRDDKGYWNQIESYIAAHSEAEFSHGICPECCKKQYPELYEEIRHNSND